VIKKTEDNLFEEILALDRLADKTIPSINGVLIKDSEAGWTTDEDWSIVGSHGD
jgi:hypothetical protein